MNMRALLAPAALLLGVAASLALTALPGTRLLAAAPAGSAAPLLVAQKPIVIPGGKGSFDFMAFDPQMRRVLAAHTGAGMLTVCDVDTGTVRQVATGTAQGVAVDARDGKYFVSDSKDQLVVVVDRKTLRKTNQIKITGPADDIHYDPKNGRVYVCHDDGTEDWVVDAKAEKIVGTVTIAGAPEVIAYDPVTDRLYQNIKTTNAVQVIDPAKNTVQATWPTAPATGPHGLVVNGAAHRLYSAGNNGKLVVLDARTGKRVASVDIAPGVDQIAFDPAKKRIYCASSRGALSVVAETTGGATVLGEVSVPKGTHTLTVDPKTHAVWICYATDTGSFLMALRPPASH